MAGSKGLIVAIDGPAASGKSTTARLLARRLGYLHIDTGAMYRAMTLKVIRAGIDPSDHERVSRLADETVIRLEPEGHGVRVFLDGEDVSDEIRKPEVTSRASSVSEIPRVREILVQAQQEMGREGGVVLEGRDIGTVVFPEADVKIYLDAEPGARALRRCRELVSDGIDVTLATVREDLERRDRYDSEREHSPLRKAPDAIITDTSDLTIDEQVALIEALVNKAIESDSDINHEP